MQFLELVPEMATVFLLGCVYVCQVAIPHFHWHSLTPTAALLMCAQEPCDNAGLHMCQDVSSLLGHLHPGVANDQIRMPDSTVCLTLVFFSRICKSAQLPPIVLML